MCNNTHWTSYILMMHRMHSSVSLATLLIQLIPQLSVRVPPCWSINNAHHACYWGLSWLNLLMHTHPRPCLSTPGVAIIHAGQTMPHTSTPATPARSTSSLNPLTSAPLPQPLTSQAGPERQPWHDPARGSCCQPGRMAHHTSRYTPHDHHRTLLKHGQKHIARIVHPN